MTPLTVSRGRKEPDWKGILCRRAFMAHWRAIWRRRPDIAYQVIEGRQLIGSVEMRGFGVIGAGTWGELHARTYASTPGARLAAICDLDRDRAMWLRDALQSDAAVYTDFDALIADPAIDAVSIVLPDFLHRDAAVAAARAGKHILLEKP